MEKCKYCQAELEENASVCPACGKEQEETRAAEEAAVTEVVEEPAAEVPAQEEAAPAEEEKPAEDTPATEEPAPAAEEKPAEIKEGIKATPGKIAAAVAVVVLILAAVVAMLIKGTAAPEAVPETTAPTEVSVETGDAAEPTDLMATEATIPADGNPDDITCKGSYTADDETVIAAGDTVVATMGDAQLTVSQLQVYYWMEVHSFLNMLYNYGMDATYYGMDYSLGLDYQTCAIANGVTWQQFFLESALGSWQNYQALALEAKQTGFELEESYRSELDNLAANLDLQAQSYGMADGKELLAYNVGNCAEIEDYGFFLENNYMGGGYLEQASAQLELTEEALEAYFDENAAAYEANGLTKDMTSVDVRHILVFPEGADNSNIRTETFSDEAWAVGEQQAQAILDAYLAGDMTEESFAALANEHSADPGSNTNGGLYTEVMQGDMVEAFDAWCFDPERKVGDTAVVRTELGFHVMYFSGSHVLWPTYVEQDMITEYQQSLLDAAVEKYPMEIDYSAIVLGFVSLEG